MGKKLLVLTVATLWLAGCATAPRPFNEFRIIYFVDRAEPGFIAPDRIRLEVGAKVLTDWGQVDAALNNESLDALIIGPGMVEKIENQDALLLAHKRGLTLIFFDTYAEDLSDLLDIATFDVGWTGKAIEPMTGDFFIGFWRTTKCANGKPAYSTLQIPCEVTEGYSGISESGRSSFAGELNSSEDFEYFVNVLAGHLTHVDKTPLND